MDTCKKVGAENLRGRELGVYPHAQFANDASVVIHREEEKKLFRRLSGEFVAGDMTTT